MKTYTLNRAIRHVVIGSLFLVLFVSPLIAQKPSLTLAQIEQLVHLHNPDAVIAGAIQQRGVSFTVTQKTLDRLTQEGAGSQTLEQLRQRIESATIKLAEGTSAAVVSVDGKVKTQFSPGFANSVEVPTGNHHITVSLEYWRPLELDVNLKNKETYTLHGLLVWAGGHINVDVKPVNAFISIHRQDAKNPFPESEAAQRTTSLGSDLVAGEYMVSATAPGYTQASEKVTVRSGETLPIHFVLQKDEAYFKRRIEAMRSRLDDRSAASILDEANLLTADDHMDPDLIDLRLRAALLAGSMQQFQGLALEVIRAGMTVTIPLQHIHLGFKDSKHPASLALTAKGLSYDPLGNACSQPNFTETWGSLQTMQFGKTSAGMPILSLHIKLSAKNGKTVTLSFTGGDLPFNSSGSQNETTANMLQTVQEVLRRQKERAATPN